MKHVNIGLPSYDNFTIIMGGNSREEQGAHGHLAKFLLGRNWWALSKVHQ